MLHGWLYNFCSLNVFSYQCMRCCYIVHRLIYTQSQWLYEGYILQNGHDRGWESSRMEIAGIAWANQTDSVTHGIWLWNKAFTVRRGDGKKVTGKPYPVSKPKI